MRSFAVLLLPLLGCYPDYGPVEFVAPEPRPLATVDDRPDSPFVSIQSDTEPLWLHFRDWITDDHAEMLMGEAERAFRLNREWGLDDPLPDAGGPDEGLDIYFIEELDDALGQAVPDASYGDRCSSYSVVRLHEGPIYWRRWTLHHEIRHNFQHGQLCSGGPAFEADATFASDAAFPDMLRGLWEYVPSFQDEPAGPPLGDAPRWGFEYGAALFHRFLAERYGDGSPELSSEALRRARLATGGVPGAVADVLADRGVGLADAYAEFAVWRLLVPSFAPDSPWPSAPGWRSGAGIDAEHVEDAAVFERRLSTGGSLYLEFDPAAGLAVDVDGDVLVQIVTEHGDEGWDVEVVEGPSVVVPSDDELDRAHLVITNVGPGAPSAAVDVVVTRG